MSWIVYRLARALMLAIGLAAVPTLALAQGGSISGNVILPNGDYLNERARVTLQTDRGIKSIVYTENRGHFQFNSLTPNVYEIVVEADGNRFEVARAKIEVFPGSPSILNVNLREKKDGTTSRVTTVSAGEIDSLVPDQAKKEFARGADAGKAGKIDDAIAHLRKAIALYPAYLKAHNDLGTYLLAQSKLREAEAEFRAAITIDSKAYNPSLNLGIVLVKQREFSEALEYLSVALTQQPESAAVKLYRGFAFEGLNDFDSAEKELKAAHALGGETYAVALFHLGQVYLNTGQRERARQMFESYLREAPNGSDAAEARKMLSVLR